MRPAGGMKFSRTEKTDAVDTDSQAVRSLGNKHNLDIQSEVLPGKEESVDVPPVPIDPQRAQQPATTLEWGRVPEVKVGDVFELDLHLRTKIRIRGLPLTLKFDQRQLELIKISNGGYMGKQDNSISITEARETSIGTVSLGLMNAQGADPSTDPLLKLKFKAIAEGKAEIMVQNAAITGMGMIPPSPQLPPRLEVEITR
jgi:hypothetical protein